MNLAIIPARIGSKRIFEKNIKRFNNYPIIYYPIKAAIESKIFDEVIVSTDSEKISKISKKYGAKIPFLREKKLSGDNVPLIDVISHTLKKYQKIKKTKINYVCCILPTAPFIKIDDLKNGFAKIKTNRHDYVISVSKFEYPIHRAFTINKLDKIKKYSPSFLKKRSQDLDSVFFDAGIFYWSKYSNWINKKNIFSKKTSIIKIPRWRVQDIDDVDDWKRAEFLFKILKKI